MIFLATIPVRVFLVPIAALAILSIGLAPSVFLQLPNESEYEPNVQRYELLDTLAQVVALSSKIARIEERRILANPRGLTSCVFDRISRAIVATEIYNRPRWVTKLEFMYYDTVVRLGFSPPKLSLGVGQVTVLTAREALQWSVEAMNRYFAVDIAMLTDDEIVDVLRNPCANAQVVFLIVRRISNLGVVQTEQGIDVRAIVSQYRGGDRELIHGFGYGDVVERLMYPKFRDVRFFTGESLRLLTGESLRRFPSISNIRELDLVHTNYEVLACSFVAGNVRVFEFEAKTRIPDGCNYNLDGGEGKQAQRRVLEVHVTRRTDLSPAEKVLFLSELFVAREMLEELELGHLSKSAKIAGQDEDRLGRFRSINVECYSDVTHRRAVEIVSGCR